MADARWSFGDRQLTVSSSGARRALVALAGPWRLREGVTLDPSLMEWLVGRSVSHVSFDGRSVSSWDSALVAFVHELAERLAHTGVGTDFGGLPDGVQRLLALARARPETISAPPPQESRPRVARLGDAMLAKVRSGWSDVALVGEVTASIGRLAAQRARVRLKDVISEMYQAGAQALPIITLTSGLLGAIMAFVGASALKPFGAGLYVANVVAIALLRELGAVMTAIVMAGRTGSSYAAQLATMKLTQELDALETMAVGAVDFLVLPRVLALSLMLPLLCVYANFVGIVGGGVVAVSMLDLSAVQYLHQTRAAATVTTFLIGVGKSGAFGVLVAFLGCRAGIRTRRSAAAVGRAATTAMVSAIVAIIAADGAFAVILQVLGV